MRVLFAGAGMYPEPGGVVLPASPESIGAAEALGALAEGWAGARSNDELRVLPIADGAARLAGAVPPSSVVACREYPGCPGGRVSGGSGGGAAQGSQGEACAASWELLRLREAGGGEVWVLDAAWPMALPVDAACAAGQAREGSTRELGEALAWALGECAPVERLVVLLGRSAVHDGGAGLVEAFGGAEGLTSALDGRDVLVAVGDGVALTGLSGAGQQLAAVAHLSPEEAQERDRAASAVAHRVGRELAEAAQRRHEHRRSLPLVQGSPAHAGEQDAQVLPSPTAWGTGAGGGAAYMLRCAGARVLPAARVMADLFGLDRLLDEEPYDLVVTTAGEVYDLLADTPVEVTAQAASQRAIAALLVAGRALLPRGEWAAAGLVGVASLEDAGAPGLAEAWNSGGEAGIAQRLRERGARLARTWSR